MRMLMKKITAEALVVINFFLSLSIGLTINLFYEKTNTSEVIEQSEEYTATEIHTSRSGNIFQERDAIRLADLKANYEIEMEEILLGIGVDDIDIEEEKTPLSSLSGKKRPVYTVSESDASYLAKTAYAEARGLTKTELACVMWCILNRCDAWGKSIASVVTAPNQFAYYSSAKTVDRNIDLMALAREVLQQWQYEKQTGEQAPKRTLPKGYLYFRGDGKHNYFRKGYNDTTYWNYSLYNY